VLIRKSVWAIPPDDLTTPGVQQSTADLDSKISEHYGWTIATYIATDPERDLLAYDGDEPGPDAVAPGPAPRPETLDEYVGKTVLLPNAGEAGGPLRA
jgi:hypothetical protein